MSQQFIELCKNNDRAIRAGLGKEMRFSVLGQMNYEEGQGSLVVAVDGSLFGKIATSTPFVLVARIDEEEDNVVFSVYNNFVDEMYGIGQIDLKEDADKLRNIESLGLGSIGEKISKLENNSDEFEVEKLDLAENEQWFKNYIEGNHWTFNDKTTFYKEEFEVSLKLFRTIVSLIKKYSLLETFQDVPEEKPEDTGEEGENKN